MDATENVREKMRRAGLVYAGPIAADGKLRRFKAEGDKNRNSWYILFAGPPTAGAFGCWKRGIKETWAEKSPKEYTDTEWREIKARWKKAEEEERKRHERAQKVAAWILNRAKPAQSHPYLERKAIKPWALQEYRGTLTLQLRDPNGELHALQFISADGTKRFLTGGRVAGCFHTLADNADGPLVIAEGYATAASIHEATGYAVICATNCGNLLAVAKAVRQRRQEREIIIAADSDQWTEGNPGLRKATGAAKAIGGKLAVPTFKDTTTKPTDFNDLHQLEGLDTVKTQIEAAAAPVETDAEAFSRFAAMPRPEYDRRRKEEAKRLNIRPATLDAEVEARRAHSRGNGSPLQGGAVDLPSPEPWPEPVDGRAVLDGIAKTFPRYVALPPGAADLLALWVAHTHCYDEFDVSPRLNITSPDKGCGKTTLRDVVASFVPRPIPAENVTPAGLFRLVTAYKPTILADEYDAWLRDDGELRGLLNAGHRRGGIIPRCEGDAHVPRLYIVFAPAVLCGIGALPGTLDDRSIKVRLMRAKRGEIPARFESRKTAAEKELCRKLARWAADNSARLAECDPQMPANAHNRLADNWRPLFAIAEVAGGDWPQRAASAFAKLTANDDSDAHGIGTMLLADIKEVFTRTGGDKSFSRDLVSALNEMKERPWPEAHHGRPITETWLARKLRTFAISPKTMRIGEERLKGYVVADFQDAFARFLPEGGLSKRDTVTAIETQAVTRFLKRDTAEPCHGFKSTQTLENKELSRCHGSNAPAAEKPKELVEELI